MKRQYRAAMQGLVAALETEISLYYAPEDRPQMLIDAITAGREALAQPQGEPVAMIGHLEEAFVNKLLQRGFNETDHLYTTPPSVEAAIKATKEKAANLAYAVCAETRHVTLGDNCAAAIRSMK